MHHFMCIAGILLTVILSLFIDDQSEEITPIWRIIYSFPLIFSFFQIFLLVFIFEDETPRYYLLKGTYNYLERSKLQGVSPNRKNL